MTWNTGSPNHETSTYTLTDDPLIRTDNLPLSATKIITDAAIGTWVDFNVTGFVSSQLGTDDKQISFLIASAFNDNKNVNYETKDGSHPPQLVIGTMQYASHTDEFSPW